MVSDAEYAAMKAKLAQVKQLFQSRHYVQCATLCDRLTRTTQEIHPIHLAYLHFYLALSHDTISRETTWKHRTAELDLAEKHYLAALTAVSTPKVSKLENSLENSPTSPDSSDDLAGQGRRISDASQRSLASSVTSVAEEEVEITTPKKNAAFLKARAMFENGPARPATPPKSPAPSRSPSRSPTKLPKRRPTPISAPNPVRFYHQEQFSAELVAFSNMIKMHLATVIRLKETTPTPVVRFADVRSRSSTISSRPISRDSTSSQGEDGERMWTRRALLQRPRFDPASVQQLCSEALSEL